jgi:hypothetical protein
MDKITAIVSLKDKASTEVKVMDNLKAMAVRATEIRDMATKVLLKATDSLRVMDSLKTTGNPKATGSPKDMVTKAMTTRDTEVRVM